MKKILIAIAALFTLTGANAQNRVNLEYTLSESKISKSLYNNISLIDTRADTADYGFVQTGLFNRIGKVISQKPISEEVKKIMDSLVGTDATASELVLQLRQWSFAETTNALSEYGYCTLKAEAYVKNGAGYQKINSIDTVVRKSAVDVTNSILRNGSKVLTEFIKASLVLSPANGDRNYTYNDVVHIDSIEKRAIPVYNSSTYTNGLYLTYEAFKNQVPDKQGVMVENDYVYPGFVKAPDEKGKLKDVQLKNTYALVHKGRPYIVTEFGFFPLNKTNNNFTFIGKAKSTPNTASIIVATAMFGAIVATLAASVADEGTYEMKIDHQNGTIVKLKEIPQPQTPSNVIVE